MNAIYIGDLDADVATNGTETVRLSTFLSENNAIRLKEELNTKPRVWYIPGHGEDLEW
jgi:Fe-S-cluster-containing hydrogenase components 1